LVDLRQQLWAARGSGAFAGAAPFTPPLFVFTSDAWLNARALQVSDHLSAADAQAFTHVYFFPSELAGDVTRLHEEAGELTALSRPMQLTAPEADEFLTRVGRAKELESRMDLGMMLLIRMSHQIGATISPSEAGRYTSQYRGFYGACIADPAQVLRVVLAADIGDLYGKAGAYSRLQLSPPELPE
jgi:hypothetical protein